MNDTGVSRTHHRDKNAAQNIARLFLCVVAWRRVPVNFQRTTSCDDVPRGRWYEYELAAHGCKLVRNFLTPQRHKTAKAQRPDKVLATCAPFDGKCKFV